MNTLKNIILLLVLLGFSSCEKMFEAYVGLPLQPTNINSEYKLGMNVFGMLNAGVSLAENPNFFEVQIIPELKDTGAIIVKDARIVIKNVNTADSFNIVHTGDGIYENTTLRVRPGEEWNYRCKKDTFLITSSTIIPNKPVILHGSLVKNDKNIRFTIKPDASAFMYDVYYLNDTAIKNAVLQRIVPNHNKATEIDIDIPQVSNKLIDVLCIIAYDENYERYINTSNTFFKPNAFRPRFSTVNGGYGCFASCSSIEINFHSSSFRPYKK